MSKFIKTLKTILHETDFILLFLCMAASIFGLIMVHSATRVNIPEGSFISRETRSMILAITIGIIMALIISFIDNKFIMKMYPAIGAVCILLMVSLFFIGVGPAERPDVKTWISLGPTGLYFQPSELVKIGFIITLSMHIELVRDKLKNVLHLFLLCVHALIPIGLVIITGDLGSALVFMVIFIAMLFCAGVQLRYFAIGIAGVCALSPVIWYYFFSSIQKERFLGLIYPERYADDIMYQQNKGLEALASGGVTGQGLFNGNYTQNDIIPESENDMIFPCIGEELGLVGCALALIILFMITLRIIYIGNKSNNEATSLMCYGVATMIASQVIINVGMCLKILPVIGITLPFFSAGGSSNLCLYIGIGLVLSIYRFDKEKAVTNFRLQNITVFQ